jgi:hypothetical protein
MTFVGPYLVGCALLVVAGLAKGIRPGDTARALHVVVPGVPLSLLRAGIRLGALMESALGVAAAVVLDRPLAGAVAASYIAFAGFVVYVRLRHGALASCGCFSTPDTPATWLHVIVNMAFGSAAVFVVTAPPTGTVFSFLGRQPLAGVPLLAACLVGTWLSYLALVEFARLTTARRILAATASASLGGGR